MKKIERIKKLVAKNYNITVDDLMGRSRSWRVVFPRQVAMTLVYETVPLIGSISVGEEFRRDHSTVLHAVKAVKNRCDTDDYQNKIVNRLRTDIAYFDLFPETLKP